MSPIFSPSYYILRDRIPFFLTILYVYRKRVPDLLLRAWGWQLNLLSAIATGASMALYFMGRDMSSLAGISWSAPSPIQWGCMIVALTGVLWYREIHIYESFYMSFLTVLGGGWIYEFAPLLFHDFNWVVFFKVNAVKVFFVEFQIFCLPIVGYIIASSKEYKRHPLLIPSFIVFALWSAFRPVIEQHVRDALFYDYNWFIRLPAIFFLTLWLLGIKGEKKPVDLFGKCKKYLSLMPFRIKEYGWKSFFYKLFVDLTLQLGIKLSSTLRWKAAHQFHTTWKNQQRKTYGIEEYNKRIDLKSREVMNNFYEIPLDQTGKTFVDVGCGTRGVLPIITAKRRIGIDPVINKLEGFTFPEGVEYLSEKAENISLPDCSVDVVCCNNTLNHVEEPLEALFEMRRILKPGGLFLLEVFIEPENIAHTVSFYVTELEGMVYRLFTPVNVKYEKLVVGVELDEMNDGVLPMRWGGVFKK